MGLLVVASLMIAVHASTVSGGSYCLKSTGFDVDFTFSNNIQVLHEEPTIGYSENYTIGSETCPIKSGCQQSFPQGRQLCNFQQRCLISTADGSVEIPGCGPANSLNINPDVVNINSELVGLCSGSKTGQRDLYIGSPGMTGHIPIYNYNCQCILSRSAGGTSDTQVTVQSRDTRLNGQGCHEQQLAFTDGNNVPLRAPICPPQDFLFMQFVSVVLKPGDQLKIAFTQNVVSQDDKGIFIMRVQSQSHGIDIECSSGDVIPPPSFAATATPTPSQSPNESGIRPLTQNTALPVLELAVGLTIGGVVILGIIIGVSVYFGLRRRRQPDKPAVPPQQATTLEDNVLYNINQQRTVPQVVSDTGYASLTPGNV